MYIHSRPSCAFLPKEKRPCISLLAGCDQKIFNYEDSAQLPTTQWLYCPSASDAFQGNCKGGCPVSSTEDPCTKSMNRLQLAGAFPDNGCTCPEFGDSGNIRVCKEIMSRYYNINSPCFGTHEGFFVWLRRLLSLIPFLYLIGRTTISFVYLISTTTSLVYLISTFICLCCK